MNSYNERIKAKMLEPPLSKIENKIWKDNFKKNREFATSVKNLNKNNGDPILQTEDSYIPKNQTVQPCKIKYFETVNKNEQKPQSRTLNETYNHYYRESENQNKRESMKKKFPNGPIRECSAQRNVHKKLFPERNKKSIMDDLLKRNAFPYKEDKYVIRIFTEYNKPSDELRRMNKRGKLLPCEQIEPSAIKNKDNLLIGQKYTYNKEIFKNTKENIFGTDNNNCNAPKTRFVHKIELKDTKDSVGSIISYQDGPKYKESKITEKPNYNSFTNLVNHNISNYRRDFVLKNY